AQTDRLRGDRKGSRASGGESRAGGPAGREESLHRGRAAAALRPGARGADPARCRRLAGVRSRAPSKLLTRYGALAHAESAREIPQVHEGEEVMNDLLFIGHPKEENLALFAGGELGPLARWRIEQHLEKCSSCQDVVADFFHLHSSVTELAELPQIDWN